MAARAMMTSLNAAELSLSVKFDRKCMEDFSGTVSRQSTLSRLIVRLIDLGLAKVFSVESQSPKEASPDLTDSLIWLRRSSLFTASGINPSRLFHNQKKDADFVSCVFTQTLLL